MSTRRSVYADRLADFSDVALGDDAVFENRGSWKAIFQQRIGQTFDHRIILEIGCFNAAYLSTIASEFPDTAFIGLDWKCKAIHDGALRIIESRLSNVILLRARAHDIDRIFNDDELGEAWIFHPDPCDGEIELRNRLIREPFLRSLHRVLKRDAVVALKTDHPGYFQWTLGLFGIPEPDIFKSARTASGATLSPRVKVSELMNHSDLPQPSDTALQLFDVSCQSADFWHDPAALSHTSVRVFSNRKTFYESRFMRRRYPIYYFEIRTK